MKPILAVQFATKANEVFSNSLGYELKTAACLNTLGMAHIRLNEFESAEEHLLSALGTFQKSNDEIPIKRVKHNLGLLYASQNMPELAIKHLEDSLENNAKTMFLLAREHFKLGYNHIANEYIENGYKISDLCYRHHFQILRALHNYAPQEELENVVIEGISYFEKEELYDWVKEYASLLGEIFYGSENHRKAQKSKQVFAHRFRCRQKEHRKKGAKMKKAILLMMMLSAVFTFGLTNVKDIPQNEAIEVFMDHGEHI